MKSMRLSMRVWDAPTRLFHWAIVVLVAVSYGSQLAGNMQLHFLSGYTLLTLLLFRLVWGFVGSETARFGRFLTSPLTGLRHLRQLGRRGADNQIGHTAAGGWMVLFMLLALLVQAVTGLFASHKDVHGPLAAYVGDPLSHRITTVHSWNFYVILGLVVLHVLAVLTYAVVGGQNLLRPMITGKKRLPAATKPPRMASSLLALLVVICAALVVLMIVRL